MNFERNIVVGILQQPTRICIISDSVDPEFFNNSVYKVMYGIIKKFHINRDRKQWMDFQLFEQTVEGFKPSKIQSKLLEFCIEFEDFDEITEETFTESFRKLLENRKKNLIEQGNIDASKNLLKGKTKDAISIMEESIMKAGELEKDLSKPINIVTDDSYNIAINEINEALEKREEGIEESVISTGFQYIDDNVYFDKKHLTIIGGYAGDGKTSLAKEIAYNNMMNGLNVLFIPLEMSLEEMRTQFICRHARTLRPNGGVRWVEVLKGAKGNLNPNEVKLYDKAYKDLINNKNIGDIHIWEAKGKHRDMGEIESRVRYMVREFDIDVVIPDYLELVRPKRYYRQKRHNVTQIAEDFKSLARDENVWLVVPHQISRKGREQAEKRKDNPHYIERDLGESSGIEKNADSILWIFSSEELKFENEAIIGVMKARMGRTIEKGFKVFADFMRASIYQLAPIRTPWSSKFKEKNEELNTVS